LTMSTLVHLFSIVLRKPSSCMLASGSTSKHKAARQEEDIHIYYVIVHMILYNSDILYASVLGDATDVKFIVMVEWAWEALQHGEDSFLVAFPSEEELARMTLQRIRREDIYQNFLPNNDILVQDIHLMEINTKDALKYMDFEEMG
ncbi:hypothetical protein ACJX0J_010401, partial [Zea mays]